MRGQIQMECRIDTRQKEARTVVMIAGHLSRASLEQFRNVIRSVESDLTLDLSNLVSADDQAVEVLRNLRREGVEIQSMSPYMRTLLLEDFETTPDNAPD